jgi:BirA family biotin operon repressor/biotin-[acetyl-CoA-carboxylase] ligase
LHDRLNSLGTVISHHVENFAHISVTDSTHATARRLVETADAEELELGSTLIIADRQDRGEGRGERSWDSPAGGLYMSWVLPNVDAGTIPLLPVLAATAASDAISALGVADVRIKWPNDILVGGKKIAGILIFARHGEIIWVAVSLGVNLDSAPKISEDQGLAATSIAEHLKTGEADGWRHKLVVDFVEGFLRSVQDPAPALERWRLQLVQKPGDEISVRLASGKTISGILEDLSSEGFLRIRHGEEETVVTGGDIIES